MRSGTKAISFAAATALVVALAGTLAACGSDHPKAQHEPSTSPETPSSPISLVLGLVGTTSEIAAWKSVLAEPGIAALNLSVKLETWPSSTAMLAQLAADRVAKTPVPDVFLADRNDLAELQSDQLIQPVDSFLSARNVDLGDGYSRDALEAFSSDDHLWCMPYAATPQVVYYNTSLVDFTAMKAAGLPVSSSPDTGKWTVTQFAAAAAYASDPLRGVKGVYVPPTLAGLAPFLYSAHGSLVDNADQPTSLALSTPASQEGLAAVLLTLSNPLQTLTRAQLKKATPLQWFERGKLAMLVGDRSLVPELRDHPGLTWDVMAMPSVHGTVTVGDYTGLCLSDSTKTPGSAANLLTYLIGNEAVADVAQSGSVVPVNTEVALADGFLQPDQPPAHAKVFVNSIRSMQVLPMPDVVEDALGKALHTDIARLFTPAGSAEVPALSALIDQRSQAVLAQFAPPPTQSSSPSD